MKLIFFGTAAFAVPALRAVASEVSLVVSQPDRPSGRGLRERPSPVKLAALELGIPVETPVKSRAPEFVERLRSEAADALLVAAYGQLLSPAALGAARQGAYNLHGSVLPRWRGAAPIQRAILAGDATTGVTLMAMDEGMDTGGIVDVRATPIGAEETYGELAERLAHIAAELAVEWAARLAMGEVAATPQPAEGATHAPKVGLAETRLEFGRSARAEYARFRAFAPAPGSSLETGRGRLKLAEVGLGLGLGAPGEVLALAPELSVGFGDGSLVLRAVQPEGRARMRGRDWANGARLRIGDNLAV